ncbi:MAG TPA: hypothetical protein VKI65_10730 [Gemmataceae bacterium]|nr:hypothetical protein [Gemmataceae bacterium]
MNPRERLLAIVLLAAILLGGGGLLGKLFLLDPLNERGDRIKLLQKQIAERTDRREQILADKQKLERWKLLSLPADVNLARREYVKQMNELLRESGFPASSYSVLTPKDVETKSNPTLAGRKEPIYSRLTFTVRAQGDLAAIVEFLERFYEAPILHQIKNIALQRPQTVGPQQRPNDLECNLTIEALIVTGVENRPQLLPNVPSRLLVLDTVAALGGGPTGLAVAAWAAGPGGPLGPGMLAEPERDYTAVAARNIFFGRQAMPARSNEYGDVLRFIHLTDITRTENKLEAFLYGRSDKSRTRLWPSMPFSILGAEGETVLRGIVVRIDDRDVYFRADGRFYAIHVGQNLREALDKPLKAGRVKELDLEKGKKPEDKKPDTPAITPRTLRKPEKS